MARNCGCSIGEWEGDPTGANAIAETGPPAWRNSDDDEEAAVNGANVTGAGVWKVIDAHCGSTQQNGRGGRDRTLHEESVNGDACATATADCATLGQRLGPGSPVLPLRPHLSVGVR